MKIDPRLKRIVAVQPYPLLFASISGAHLYGLRLAGEFERDTSPNPLPDRGGEGERDYVAARKGRARLHLAWQTPGAIKTT